MAEVGRDPQAVQFYRRVRDEVAEHRVVDAAEAVITSLWVAELEEMRRSELGMIAATSVAAQLALRRLRQALAAGGTGELARCRARVEAVHAEQVVTLARSRAMITRMDTELGRVESVEAERGRRAEGDLSRLRLAWSDAYGAPCARRPSGDIHGEPRY
jgi:hypothetical protein